MKKSVLLYCIAFALWAGLLAATISPLLRAIDQAEHHSMLTAVLVTISTLFIGYFWLNGMKDLVYTLYYYLRKQKLVAAPPNGYWRQKFGNKARMKVVMVYCTCNDFNAESLLACMNQNYPNHEVVILDDSKKPEYIAEINAFAKEHGVKVVRRDNNIGYKAGNLNNYLRKADFDYFVILDSDEIIPPNFITRSLDYFAYYQNAGIIQANHIATRNRNKFMRLFAIGVNSHWTTYQAVKHHHGFLSLLGHGAMVSRECYEAAGGFPHLVAEDLCFSIEARSKGYYVAFAPDIICEEEYPIDYLAFKKRHSKWTQGNMEFIKKYTWRIFTSNMTWYEKLDIILFTYSLPLTFFFASYVVINVAILPLLGHTVTYPVWLLIPTGIFLIAPMLNDIIYYYREKNIFSLAWYLLHSMILYGSMMFVSLKSSIKSAFGKSVFLVTPKDSEHITFKNALWLNRAELIFGISLIVISIAINESPLPTLMIAGPGMFSVYLSMMANQKRRESMPERIISPRR